MSVIILRLFIITSLILKRYFDIVWYDQGFPCRSGGCTPPYRGSEGVVVSPCDGSPDNSCGCNDSNVANSMLENVHRNTDVTKQNHTNHQISRIFSVVFARFS